jgi:hypothetical protein
MKAATCTWIATMLFGSALSLPHMSSPVGEESLVQDVSQDRHVTVALRTFDFLVDFQQRGGAVSRRQLQGLPSISTCDMERVASSCADPNALLVDDMCSTDCAHAIADSFDGCQRDPTAYETVANIRDMVHVCQPCSSNPCNDGVCQENASPGGSETGKGITCQCNPGWGGAECTEKVDVCESRPCTHGAVCTSQNVAVGSIVPYTCACQMGFTGDSCSDEICASSPCAHGECSPTDRGRYDCACTAGYQGGKCESAIDYCNNPTNPCQNRARCRGSVGGYNCECRPGFYGDTCETEVCASYPCLNGATVNLC